MITLCPKVSAPSGGGRESFRVSSVKLWNGLPDKIKRRNSLLSFKNALKLISLISILILIILKSYCKYFYVIVDNYFNF